MKAGRGRLTSVLKHLELHLTVDPWAADYGTPVRCEFSSPSHESNADQRAEIDHLRRENAALRGEIMRLRRR